MLLPLPCKRTRPSRRAPSRCAYFQTPSTNSRPMKNLILAGAILLAPLASAHAQRPTSAEISRWQKQARAVTITRDDWGIAHIAGHTDGDAVFGLLYAQAED